MDETLIILGILLLVAIAEFLIWRLSDLFNDDYAIGLFATNIVFVTILVSLRILGK